MSAERLREAAKVLRERAWATQPGPWAPDVRANGRAWVDFAGVDDHALSLHGYPAEATYIATVHPGVGFALADWLDAVAQRAEEVASTLAPNSRAREPIVNSLLAFSEAVTVADAILGGAS